VSRRDLKAHKAQAEISIDFRSASDAEAMKHALAPETSSRRATRALVEVTRRGRVTKMRFYAKDLVALRAMVNSFLRFAATWRRVSNTIRDDRGPAKTRRIT